MVSLEQEEEKEAFLDVPLSHRQDETAPRSGWPRALALYLRLALELAMAAVIAFLLVKLLRDSSQKSLTPSPVPPCMSHTTPSKVRDSDAASSPPKDIHLQRGYKISE